MPYKDKEDRKKYNKKYYEENKDKVKAKAINYYKENKDKINERRKKQYKEDIDVRQRAYESNKTFRENNRDKYRQYNKKYREKNKDKIREQQKVYESENRDTINERSIVWAKAKNKESRLTASNHRNLWEPEEDERLIKMKKKGYTREEMAKSLGRTIGAVDHRLGLLRKNGDQFNGNPVDL